MQIFMQSENELKQGQARQCESRGAKGHPQLKHLKKLQRQLRGSGESNATG